MFSPRVAIASLSGESDAAWARRVASYIGAAFLGGIALDARSRAAARQMVAARDRDEFLPSDPIEFIGRELDALADSPIRPGVNVRSTTLTPIRNAAEVCREENAILEINAHCRQAELCGVGCGESLLGDPARLCRFVRVAAAEAPLVSVKVRAGIEGVDLPGLAEQLTAAGADILHVDAMDSEPVIAEIDAVRPPDSMLIANNGVRDRRSAVEYLEYGADAVSIGRPSDRPSVLERVRSAVDDWMREQEAPA